MTKFLGLLLLPIFLLGQTNYSDKMDHYMKAQADLYNFSGTVSIPKKHIQNPIDTSVLKKYVGNYEETYMGITYKTKIIQKGGKLFEYVNGADDVELKPETEKVFFTSSIADRQLIFDTDSKGNVTRIWRNIAGLQTDLIKK